MNIAQHDLSKLRTEKEAISLTDQKGRILKWPAKTPPAIQTSDQGCPCCNHKECNAYATVKDFEYATSSQPWLYNRCDKCGAVYLGPRPQLSEMSRIYPPTYYSYADADTSGGLVSRIWQHLQRRRAKTYRAYTGKLSGRALDVGCGDGSFLKCFAEFAGDGWQCEGVEIGSNAGVVAKNAGLAVHQGAIEDISLEVSSYDIIWMQQVIEHVPYPAQTIARLFELLKQNGVMVLETPDISGLDAKIFKKRHWGGFHAPRHLVLWDKRSLRQLVETNGFSVKHQQSLVSPVFWALSMRNRAIDRSASTFAVKFWADSNPMLMACATAFDVVQSKVFRRSSNQRLVAVKP